MRKLPKTLRVNVTPNDITYSKRYCPELGGEAVKITDRKEQASSRLKTKGWRYLYAAMKCFRKAQAIDAAIRAGRKKT